MRTISPLDLRRSLGSILDAASAGERFLIERDHRPLAMLVSVEDGGRLDESADELRKRRLAALDRLGELAKEWATEHPRPADLPDIVTILRQERSRDDPDGYPEYPEDAGDVHA
jgi:antitoxin (DNA-binding transcriptional repressor) of toxin-antitoxin stability system